jgi:hydroxymethylpyrimidine/phosphomethylpyrimidine kinase
MLASAAIVEAVAAAVEDLEVPLLVVDPVMVATSGEPLLDDEAVAMLKAELLRRAFVVTPNLREAERLSGVRIETETDRREAAVRLQSLGARAVIITGGHFPSPEIVDVLYDGRHYLEFRHARVPGSNSHGTGCTFAAALTAHLALGRRLEEAIPLAQQYVAGAILHARKLGRGNGPLDHFWQSHDRRV